MNSFWRKQMLSFVLLLTLLLTAGMNTRAAPAAPQYDFDCVNVTEIPQHQCEALVALYESTDGANWTYNTGWLETITPCNWYGVTCGEGGVTSLKLQWNQLNGSIPSELGDLSALMWLQLHDNQLSGSIPSELGKLTALTTLYLYRNQLSGSIPSRIGDLTALTLLYLYGNQLSGPIPSELGNLSALTSLELNDNQLSGSIPPRIGDLTALTVLQLEDNQLSGPIPSELGNLEALSRLHLSDNQLSGPIPSELGNLTTLVGLSLDSNQLSDPIPSELSNLTRLTWLHLNDNQLSGPIPSELGDLTKLEGLWLHDNQLNGSIPPEIGGLTALTTLRLDSNQLSGSIPSELGDLTALTSLYLDSNQLSDPIPSELGNLSALTALGLHGNQLSGSIPSELGDLIALTWLHLHDNQLSGPIPSELGDLTALTALGLDSNQLSGPIPSELSKLSELGSLGLSGNQLSGSIPGELGDLSALVSLWLSNNQLSGPIPSELGNLTALKVLRLHRNQLSGPIPNELGNLSALIRLELHANPFSGEVPTALTPLTLTSFTFYDTDWCVPSTGAVHVWLNDIPKLYGTGLICGEGLGSLSGTVTLTDTTPIAGMQVNLYRSTLWPQWQHLTTTHTTAGGAYQFTDLGQGLGIDYRVQFVDSTHQLAPQYYDVNSTIATADVITITPGIPRTGIDAILALPQPPAAEVDTATGSVAYHPDGTAQITMPRPKPSDITITRAVTCTAGTPSTVTLLLSTGPTYSMTNVSGALYQATIPADDLTGNATLSVAATCGVTTTETTVGYITLYDPSGYITDYLTGQPVVGAKVTLYNVPGWEPKTGPDDDRPYTCESNLSKSEGDPWNQPAPTDLGIISNADVTPTDPSLPYQQTNVDGYYGWDVSEGCWYVTAEAAGYEPLTSPVVGVPPEVTDLNLALKPEGMQQVYLPLILRQ